MSHPSHLPTPSSRAIYIEYFIVSREVSELKEKQDPLPDTAPRFLLPILILKIQTLIYIAFLQRSDEARDDTMQ